MSIHISGKAACKLELSSRTSGIIFISGKAVYSFDDYKSLIDFIPFSKNRKYNVGLDENNKYPEDYIENYADMLKG